MEKDMMECVRALSGLCGVSGDEGSVREAIIARLPDGCDFSVDPTGNLLVCKKGERAPKNKLLLSAHMDEVGFIVTHIEDSGLLRFASVGGIDSRVVVGKAVEVGSGRLYGVIGAKATHHLEEKEKGEPIRLDKLYIDIGAQDREDARQWVKPGDRAVFYASFGTLGENKIMGRALDDRVGCALLLALLQGNLPCDCHFAFTVQEEVGCAGAVTAGYTVAPDISLVVETTTASDIAGVEADKVVCRLGGGPVLSFMDKGAVYDAALYAGALDIAKTAGIPCQSKEGVFGGNEARAFQTARAGARVLAVSVPCRYLHSPSCVAQTEDLHHTLKLLEALIPAFAELV